MLLGSIGARRLRPSSIVNFVSLPQENCAAILIHSSSSDKLARGCGGIVLAITMATLVVNVRYANRPVCNV